MNSGQVAPFSTHLHWFAALTTCLIALTNSPHFENMNLRFWQLPPLIKLVAGSEFEYISANCCHRLTQLCEQYRNHKINISIPPITLFSPFPLCNWNWKIVIIITPGWVAMWFLRSPVRSRIRPNKRPGAYVNLLSFTSAKRSSSGR